MTHAVATLAGERMVELAELLFPICRSITGNGVRATLAEIGKRVPLEVHEVPSGTAVLDWTVPDEWNIRDAYIATADGRRVVDFQESNLHVVSYSEPIAGTFTLDELRPHLHTHVSESDWVPYRTAYYERSWGFCLSQRTLDTLQEGSYEVVVDTTLEPGSLTYGECLLPGELEHEVLISTHVCHPSLANDNVSGMVVLTELAAALAERSHRRLTYRFLLIPGTIGSITWLARNETSVARTVAGLVLACVGDQAALEYKRSRAGTTVIDVAASHVVERDELAKVSDFVPWGWDERQFNSPGFALPVGALTRSPEGAFREYHSSADNLSLIGSSQLESTLDATLAIVDVLENDRTCSNLSPYGEPQLGRRGLYRAVGGSDPSSDQLGMLWILNQSDGTRSLLDVAVRSGLPFQDVDRVARRLEDAGLLEMNGWSLP